MIRIECKCKTCRGNNDGQPLAALITEKLHSALGGKNFHGTVWTAHDPSPVGAAVRKATGVQPA
jgi:hypothetical protein